MGVRTRDFSVVWGVEVFLCGQRQPAAENSRSGCQDASTQGTGETLVNARENAMHRYFPGVPMGKCGSFPCLSLTSPHIAFNGRTGASQAARVFVSGGIVTEGLQTPSVTELA